MSSDDLLKTRIKQLKSSSIDGECVIYVMSRDQRVRDNHALLAAQKHALAKSLPLAVVFCLYDKVGVRAREHYQFMVDGLASIESDLRKLNIPFMMVLGDPKERIAGVMHHTSPEAVYFDFNPLRGSQKLQNHISENADCKVFVVDTHNMIPVWVTSEKREVGARTIRSKIHKKFGEYLIAPESIQNHPHDWPGTVKNLNELAPNIENIVNRQPSNGSVISFKPGEQAAIDHLDTFAAKELKNYEEDRNDPANDSLSNLSPYLHFGHISSLRVALKMRHIVNGAGKDLHLIDSSKMPQSDDAPNKKVGSANALLEEMIVRKELSDNFCYYEDNYDSITSADNWAKKTIAEHDDDPREFIYSYKELESAKTHDAAWNAAQRQMMRTGKMHGYMRMYWAKKIKEWTGDAKTAIKFAIQLNDHYSIDGGDPNGYVGILWSIAGVHDRAWTEREVFGKIRYMNYGGLKRKFKIEEYEKQWQSKKS